MEHFKIYRAVSELPNGWNNLAQNDIFLQQPYLKGLEQSTPSNITLFFIGIFKEEEMVGVALIQLVNLQAKEIFRTRASSKIPSILRAMAFKLLNGNVLVVGNLMHTGPHGFHFNSDKITQAAFLNIIFKALDAVKIQIKSEDGVRINALLFKDFFDREILPQSQMIFRQGTFHNIEVQPSMILQIPEKWKTLNDYQNDLLKKYKARLRNTRQKLGKISLQEMTPDELLENSELLHHLYKNVSDKASFNTFLLSVNHFYILKQELQENFKVFAYYSEGHIIGFYTLILNGSFLETYFLGYERELQEKFRLYHNMLFEMISFGIDHKFSEIRFGRTALEIKSSVGASPKTMSMYIKHCNPVINKLVKLLMKITHPPQNWKERHPFKM